jgi:SAM-dependent methyltransferase
VLAEVLHRSASRPQPVGATESWPPNLTIARRNLEPFGARVFEVDPTADLPSASASLDLVVARHPVTIRWKEIARVLAPGGTYFAQHIGPGSNAALTNALMGPQPLSDARSAARAVAEASAAGLQLVDVRGASLRVAFYDIGAVVYFLRKVPWTVPSFTLARYEKQLREIHERIESEGQFVSNATRFLVELRKP